MEKGQRVIRNCTKCVPPGSGPAHGHKVPDLRYKLRMMGVPIDGPCDVFCDNEPVVKNITRPESLIKKKHNSIAYHKAIDNIAVGIIRIAKEDGVTKIADIFTK